MEAITKSVGSEITANPCGMADLLQRFIDYIDVKDVTVKSYAVCLRSFAEWISAHGITEPKRADILAYVHYLSEPHERRARYDRPGSKPGNVITLSAGTQARYLRAVKLFFKWTAQEGLYPNVADNIKGARVRADNTKRDPLGREDALEVLGSIDRTTAAGKRDYAMILLCITAGLRIIEVQRANVGNMETVAGQHVLYIQGKGHDEADTYKKMTPEVYAAIMDYLKTRGPLSQDAPLFAGIGNRSHGKRLAEPSISRIIKQRLKAAGFDTHRITAHSLRHTSVTFLLEAGATIQEAQHHARHASPETTGIYAHNIDQRKEQAEQRVYDYLFGVEHDTAKEAQKVIEGMDEEKRKKALELLKAIAA